MEEPGTQIPSAHIRSSEWTLNLGLEVQVFAGMNVAASQHQVHTRTKFDCVTSGLDNEGARQKKQKNGNGSLKWCNMCARKNQRDSCEWIEGDVQLLLTITLEYKGDRSSVVVVVVVDVWGGSGSGRGYRHTCEGPAAVVKTDAVRLNSTIYTM